MGPLIALLVCTMQQTDPRSDCAAPEPGSVRASTLPPAAAARQWRGRSAAVRRLQAAPSPTPLHRLQLLRAQQLGTADSYCNQLQMFIC